MEPPSGQQAAGSPTPDPLAGFHTDSGRLTTHLVWPPPGLASLVGRQLSDLRAVAIRASGTWQEGPVPTLGQTRSSHHPAAVTPEGLP